MTPARAVLGWLFFGGIGLAVLVLAGARAAEGDWLTAAICLGFAGFCLGVVYPVRRSFTREVSPAIDHDGTGVRLRPDRRIDLPLMVAVFSLVLASAADAVLAPFGLVHIPVPALNPRYTTILCAFAAVVGAPYAVLLAARGSCARIRLTPSGYELWQGFVPGRAEWRQIADIRRAEPDSDEPHTVFVVLANGDEHAIATAAFTPDAAAVRGLLRLYWQHPDRRGELADRRAVDRVRGLLRAPHRTEAAG